MDTVKSLVVAKGLGGMDRRVDSPLYDKVTVHTFPYTLVRTRSICDTRRQP